MPVKIKILRSGDETILGNVAPTLSTILLTRNYPGNFSMTPGITLPSLSTPAWSSDSHPVCTTFIRISRRNYGSMKLASLPLIGAVGLAKGCFVRCSKWAGQTIARWHGC